MKIKGAEDGLHRGFGWQNLISNRIKIIIWKVQGEQPKIHSLPEKQEEVETPVTESTPFSNRGHT